MLNIRPGRDPSQVRFVPLTLQLKPSIQSTCSAAPIPTQPFSLFGVGTATMKKAPA
jgi:hypothetical protein